MDMNLDFYSSQFYFCMYGYSICMYLCVPHACLVPMEEEGVRVPELESVVT